MDALQPAQLTTDDFSLFGLPARFELDLAALDVRWKNLQRQAHPDKFAAQGAAAQRIALQWSARINEAYQRLRDPLRRAAYLCEHRAVPIDAENNTHMAGEFLLQQMQWRESLEEAQSLSALTDLHEQAQSARVQGLRACGALLDEQMDTEQAAQKVRQLMFIERFLHDIEERMDRVSA